MKAYFLPLKKEYYMKFKRGEQICEIRPAGHHGWNKKNIYAGRRVLLSNGYGKHDRMEGVIHKLTTTDNLKTAGVAGWHVKAVTEIYGERPLWMVAWVADLTPVEM